MEEVGAYDVMTSNLLGRGGFGEVFLATERASGRRAAAKRVWLQRDVRLFQEIMQEVQALKHIKPHVNIVEFYESIRADKFLWMFTEYCECGDLQAYSTQHELALYHKVDIASQAAAAIAHLHNLKPAIVHRDIKPNNILLSHKDNRVIIKMTDFGLAKVTNGTWGGTTRAMRTFCGTELYMAPEQFRVQATGRGVYDHSVDVFALGLLTMSLIDSAPPNGLNPMGVRGKPVGHMMWRMAEEGQELWSPVRFSIDEPRAVREVKSVASIMVSHAPDMRPSAAEVRRELDALLGDMGSNPGLPKPVKLDDDYYWKLLNGQAEDMPLIEEDEEDQVDPFCEQADTVIKKVSPAKAIVRFLRERKNVIKKQPELKRKRNMRRTIHYSLDQPSSPPPEHERVPKFVVVGGVTGTKANVSTTCWVLETPDDGYFWQGLADLPLTMALNDTTVAQVGSSSFMVMGGLRGSRVSAKTVLYDAAADSWRQTADLPTARCSAGAVEVRGKLYVMGGEGQRNAILDSCECYNVATNRWLASPPMLQAMIMPICAVANGSIYVVFNSHKDNKAKGRDISLQCFSLMTRRWSFKRSMPRDVHDTLGASAVGLGAKLYVVGGWDKLCAQYDAKQDAWTLLRNTNDVHLYHSVTCFEDRISLLGGCNANGPSKQVEEYDVNTDTWRVRVLEMPEPLHFHHAMVLHLEA